MKDFKVAPVMIDDEQGLVYEAPPENEAALSRYVTPHYIIITKSEIKSIYTRT